MASLIRKTAVLVCKYMCRCGIYTKSHTLPEIVHAVLKFMFSNWFLSTRNVRISLYGQPYWIVFL